MSLLSTHLLKRQIGGGLELTLGHRALIKSVHLRGLSRRPVVDL